MSISSWQLARSRGRNQHLRGLTVRRRVARPERRLMRVFSWCR